MGGPNDHPRLEFRSRAAIRAWLEANHAKETTFWLMTFKKHVGEYYVPYGEVVIEPDDLARALDKTQRARQNFDSFSPSARKVILLWIKTAKQDETRARRISETVRLATKNVKAAHPEAKGQ